MSDDREERIRRRAYEIWEAEGSPGDRHEQHWQRATGEIDAASDAPAPEVSLDSGADGEGLAPAGTKRSRPKPGAAKAGPAPASTDQRAARSKA